MFSTCTCFAGSNCISTILPNGSISYVFMIVFVAGYKGWGCTDESEAVSEIDLLAATLLLCLSNLLYLPAVGLAIYRGFYTESFVYFANMIASTVCILHNTKIHLGVPTFKKIPSDLAG